MPKSSRRTEIFCATLESFSRETDHNTEIAYFRQKDVLFMSHARRISGPLCHFLKPRIGKQGTPQEKELTEEYKATEKLCYKI